MRKEKRSLAQLASERRSHARIKNVNLSERIAAGCVKCGTVRAAHVMIIVRQSSVDFGKLLCPICWQKWIDSEARKALLGEYKGI